MKSQKANRILIIEDERILLKMISQLLRDAGYESREASNAAAGLKECAEHGPDLILLDVQLPDANGIELCDLIKADASMRRVPILIMSGEATAAENRADALNAGASGYILKPFENKNLLSLIKSFLEPSAKTDSSPH